MNEIVVTPVTETYDNCVICHDRDVSNLVNVRWLPISTTLCKKCAKELGTKILGETE